MKKIFEKIRDGIGQGVGLVLVFVILFGVYAFVEPTQGPNAGSNYLNKGSPIGKVQWAGYTALTYNGNLGYTKGANTKCDSNFPGSKAMTYNDYLDLGNKYPYTNTVWLIDGAYSSGYDHTTGNTIKFTKDGYFYEVTHYSRGVMCGGWSTPTGIPWKGPFLQNTGTIMLGSCSSSYKLACVY